MLWGKKKSFHNHWFFTSTNLTGSPLAYTELHLKEIIITHQEYLEQRQICCGNQDLDLRHDIKVPIQWKKENNHIYKKVFVVVVVLLFWPSTQIKHILLNWMMMLNLENTSASRKLGKQKQNYSYNIKNNISKQPILEKNM